jgi:flagellar hook capping protein FlgD
MNLKSITLAIVCFALTASLTSRRASADWPALGRALTTAGKGQQHPKTTTDGAGGAIIVWHDDRSPRVDIFAQHVLVSGEVDPAWPVDGRALLGDSTAQQAAFEGQQFPVIVSDGAGGAIVAWPDGRNASTNLDIFAQHVLASGVLDPAWPVNGLALSAVRGDQDNPAIASDGAGGAIVTWTDGRSGFTGVDVFAQHVLNSGVADPAWPVNGVALSTAPDLQSSPQIVSDGSGGAIVTWTDFRPSATGVDVYAQHVRSTGIVDPAWPVNGRVLALAPGTQQNPSIVSDGAHGALVAWEDFRDGTGHIYAQRVLGSGVIAAGWLVDGLAVATAPLGQEHPIVASDGRSGALVAWQDLRNGENHNPFVQHVLAAGAIDPAWPVNGRALSLSSGEQVDASIVTDAAGGAIVAWEEDSFILANHVLASGVLDPTFPVNGRFMRLLLTFQGNPDLTVSSGGNAIVAWSDRSQTETAIYAQQVLTEETLAVDPGTPGSTVAFARPNPNPARGPVTLSFALPRQAPVQLVIYDLSGRRVRALMSGLQAAGRHEVAWDQRDDGGRLVSAGIRFARLEVEGHALTEKVVTTR